MKNRFLITGLLLIAGIFIKSNAAGQLPACQNPTGTDRVWGSSNTTIDGINTAMIDIDTFDSGNGALDRLVACAFYGPGGANPGGIIVTDLTHGYTVNVAYPVGGLGTMASTPDIIIGNNVNSAHPKEDFIMAVAFINSGGDVEIDYFDIHYTTPWMVFTVTYNSSNIVSMVAGFIPYQTVHIDVVADHVATPLYGNRPVCDSFFVVFDVLYVGGPGGTPPDAHAAMGSLGAYWVSGAVDVTNSVHVIDNEEPDVAGVQLYKPGGVRDVARIVWRGQGPATIYEADWDPTAGTFAGSTLSSSITQYYYHPRIDADDDYTTDSSTANADWKVATEVYYYGPPSSEERVYTFDNLGGPYLTSNRMTSTISTFTGCGGSHFYYQPAVAFGPNNGNHYMVTEYAEDQCANGDYVVMDPIDKSFSTDIALDPPVPSVRSYFGIDNPGGGLSLTAGYGYSNYANSVSTPCNNVTDTSLIAWAFYDPGSTMYYIDFKTNLYNSGLTHGYAYKTLPDDVPKQLITAANEISVFPNPATDYITIVDPAKSADGYRIINVLGQQVAGGAVTAAGTTVPLNDLCAGSYIVNICRQENICSRQVFVKE